MLSEEEVTRMREIQMRRLRAYMDNRAGHTPEELKELEAETTTQGDYDFMNAIYHRIPQDLQLYVRLTEEMWGDFGRYRCSVCAHTPKQAAALGYNCGEDC